MYIVHVFIQVKPEYIDDFITATVDNARNSINEPGIARFDFIQQIDEPSQFMLIEVYRSPDDPGKHKETEHYKTWKDKVEQMMETQRKSQKYSNVYPDEKGWG